jgi:hypothetical protein
MRRLVAILLLAQPLPAPLTAQVDLTAHWAVAGHAGHAAAPTDDQPSMHPGIGGEVTAAIGFRRGRWRTQLSVRSNSSDLVLVGDASGIITPGAVRDLALTLELGGVVAGAGGGPSLAILATLSRHRWSFPQFDDPTRTRWGGGLAVEASIPITGRWLGVVRAEAGMAGSLFEEAELPADFVRQRARRSALGVGVRWAP